VHEISADGLSFQPNGSYRSLLKNSGADARVAAVDSARVATGRTPEDESVKALLQHIASAATLTNVVHHEDKLTPV
jgi:hypothetical protein